MAALITVDTKSREAIDTSSAFRAGERLLPCIVRIVNEMCTIRDDATKEYASKSSGSGVLIHVGAPDGEDPLSAPLYFVTNNHVIASSGTCYACHPILGNDIHIPLTLCGSHAKRDIALVRIDNPARVAKMFEAVGMDKPYLAWLAQVHEVGAVRVADTRHIVLNGQDSVAIGYPLGQTNATITEGLINNYQVSPADPTRICLQLQAPINHGNSGGGLFVYRGPESTDIFYVGMPSLGIDGANLVGYAYAAHEIIETANYISSEFDKEGVFQNVEGPYTLAKFSGNMFSAPTSCRSPFKDIPPCSKILTLISGDEEIPVLPDGNVSLSFVRGMVVPLETAILALPVGPLQISYEHEDTCSTLCTETTFYANIPVRSRVAGADAPGYLALGPVLITDLSTEKISSLDFDERFTAVAVVVGVHDLPEAIVRPGSVVVAIGETEVHSVKDIVLAFQAVAGANVDVVFRTSGTQYKITLSRTEISNLIEAEMRKTSIMTPDTYSVLRALAEK